MKKLFNINYDVTDYLVSNDVQTVANTVAEMSGMAKSASIHSTDERDMLDNENVALVLFHPHLGELKKFACDEAGVTEVNLGLLSKNLDNLPEEVIKIAANNLGYVANQLNVQIPETLLEYQTNQWVSPVIDTSHINKIAFYKKLQANVEEVSLEKVASGYSWDPGNLDITKFSEELEINVKARLNMTHNEKAQELYTDILEKYSEYTPAQVAAVMDEADDYANMGKAIDRGMIKNAAVATFGFTKTSWYSTHVKSLQSKDLTYLSENEKEDLFGEEGEAVFDSLPMPTRVKLMTEV